MQIKDFRNDGESYASAFSRRVNIKVAKITNITKHPEGDKLYILTLDTAEDEPRTIVSSIVPFYREDELLGHNILLVSNLKPANFRGVKSRGMLLAASQKGDESHETCEVLFLDAAEAGENVFPEGEEEVEGRDYSTYIKPEHFFSIPLKAKDGIIYAGDKKLVSERSKLEIKCYKYTDGNIG